MVVKMVLGLESKTSICISRRESAFTRSKTTNLLLRKVRIRVITECVLGDQFFDEVGNWLRRYGFFNKYGELCKAKGIVQLKELS